MPYSPSQFQSPSSLRQSALPHQESREKLTTVPKQGPCTSLSTISQILQSPMWFWMQSILCSVLQGFQSKSKELCPFQSASKQASRVVALCQSGLKGLVQMVLLSRSKASIQHCHQFG